jgi:NADH-quinone oxidoreductase subunit L
MMGGYFHLTTHAFFKALLFLGAGSVIHAVHSNELTDMGGLRRKMGPTFVLFLVGALALAGFPGLAGFFSKDLILEELFEAHLWGPLGMLLAAAALTAFYMTRVVCMAFLGETSEKASHAHESPIAMVGPMALLGLLAVVAGYGASGFAEDLGLEYAFHLSPVGIAATLLALGGIGVGYVKYGQGGLAGLSLPGVAAFIRGGPVDSLFVGGFSRALLPFAAAMGWLDRYVVDGVMNLVGVGALDAGARLRRIQSGQIQHLLVGVALGLVVFALWGVVGA